MNTAWIDLTEEERKFRMFWAIAPIGCEEKYPGVPYSTCARLARVEQSNRRRAHRMGCESMPVDFTLICVEQDWKCCICGEPMNLKHKGDKPNSVSLEHDIALGCGGGHTPWNVKGAHRRCNITKGQEKDGPRAAKLKRMAGETGQYARRKRNGPQIQSRGFDKNYRKKLNGQIEKIRG